MQLGVTQDFIDVWRAFNVVWGILIVVLIMARLHRHNHYQEGERVFILAAVFYCTSCIISSITGIAREAAFSYSMPTFTIANIFTAWVMLRPPSRKDSTHGPAS